jgi:hypothetical protein
MPTYMIIHARRQLRLVVTTSVNSRATAERDIDASDWSVDRQWPMDAKAIELLGQ